MSHLPTQNLFGFHNRPNPFGGGGINPITSNNSFLPHNHQAANNFNSSFGSYGYAPFLPYGYQQPDYQLLQIISQLIQQVVTALIQNLNQAFYNPGNEIQSIDGSGNNPYNAALGQANSLFIRTFNADPSRGIGGAAEADLPSTREVSNAVSAQTGDTQNAKGLSDMFWLWGQFLDHDITLTEVDLTKSANIAVPDGDPWFDPAGTGTQEITFHRSHSVTDGDGNPARLNEITAFIDGSNVYGSDEEKSNELRSFSGGLLKVSEGDLMPIGEDGMFKAGDVRANEQPGLTAMHTLWVREHNRIATDLAQQNPGLNDEQLFQAARQEVIAQMQAITFNEFLPALVGEENIDPYFGYNPNVNPQISETFSTAAYRFGHSMISPTLLRLDEDGNEIPEGNLSLRDAFFNPSHVKNEGIDPIFRGFATQVAQAADPMVIDDVRNLLFGQPGSGGLDLAALNMQRGRDHELPSYNAIREAMGLRSIESFDDPIFQGDFGQKLAQVYDHPDDVDAWVGGLAENAVGTSLMGETMTLILKDQFERLRDGDRFWYENRYSDAKVNELNNLKLSDIIKRNTDIQNIQDDVLFAPNA